MLDTIVAIVAVLSVVCAGLAMDRYWQLVERDSDDDVLPDPVLLAMIGPRPEVATAAAPAAAAAAAEKRWDRGDPLTR